LKSGSRLANESLERSAVITRDTNGTAGVSNLSARSTRHVIALRRVSGGKVALLDSTWAAVQRLAMVAVVSPSARSLHPRLTAGAMDLARTNGRIDLQLGVTGDQTLLGYLQSSINKPIQKGVIWREKSRTECPDIPPWRATAPSTHHRTGNGGRRLATRQHYPLG